MRTYRFLLAVAAAALLVLPLSGCAQAGFFPFGTPTPVPTPTAVPTPSPSPTPVPVVAVFGADDSPSFAEGVSDAAENDDLSLSFVTGGVGALAEYEPAGAAAAVVFLTGSADELPNVDFPLYVYAADGQTVSEEVPHLTYDDAGAAAAALELAIAYPPHETPVRMIGLFCDEDGDAYALWKAAVKKGRVYAKAVYFESDASADASAGSWLAGELNAYYPGMLDAVYAETGDLAVSAASVLLSKNRDDIEVFAASTGGGADRMLSAVLPAAVGANLYDAGGLCYRRARALLFGLAAESSVLPPERLTFSSQP